MVKKMTWVSTDRIIYDCKRIALEHDKTASRVLEEGLVFYEVLHEIMDLQNHEVGLNEQMREIMKCAIAEMKCKGMIVDDSGKGTESEGLPLEASGAKS